MMLRRGMWDLPKGHREDGESLRECAAREVCEECGLRAEALEVGAELIRTEHSYFYEPRQRWEKKLTTWFAMSYSGSVDDIAPQTEEDITALEWVSPAEARRRAEGSFDTIRQVIEAAVG